MWAARQFVAFQFTIPAPAYLSLAKQLPTAPYLTKGLLFIRAVTNKYHSIGREGNFLLVQLEKAN